MKHTVNTTKENVKGYPGAVARCSCGWEAAWIYDDKSAESDGASHLRVHSREEVMQ